MSALQAYRWKVAECEDGEQTGLSARAITNDDQLPVSRESTIVRGLYSTVHSGAPTLKSTHLRITCWSCCAMFVGLLSVSLAALGVFDRAPGGGGPNWGIGWGVVQCLSAANSWAFAS